MSGQEYVTESGYPAADTGPLQAMHSHMPEAEPLPEPRTRNGGIHMSHIEAEYNGDVLTPDQIELLHTALEADMAEWAEEPDEEPEAEP